MRLSPQVMDDFPRKSYLWQRNFALIFIIMKLSWSPFLSFSLMTIMYSRDKWVFLVCAGMGVGCFQYSIHSIKMVDLMLVSKL